MENRRRVTEEDLLLTESMIAESFGRLKQSAFQAPSRSLGSLSGTIRKHPVAAAATAVIAGAVVFGIIRLITSRASVQETQGISRVSLQRDTGRPDYLQEMMSMIFPLVVPFITGYIQKYIGRILSGERE
ncbi:MAG: hypothetical protein WC294_01830 [Methanoregula sp.]|jgi:hypothetical protein